MKTILYMAVSVNGRITQGADDSDWVSETDWTEFDKLKRESRVMVMGGRTFEQFADDFPQDGALNVVMTHNAELLDKNIPNALFTDLSPKELISELESKGYSQVMLIGGMELNTSFMKDGLIDEIWLSVHPLFIGSGKTLTQEFDAFTNLEFLGCKQLNEGLVQLRYRVSKKQASL